MPPATYDPALRPDSSASLRSNRRAWTDERDPFLGESARMDHLSRAAVRMLGTAKPILILGETGVGKGVLARWLHEQSDRYGEAFVDVGCAGRDTEYLEGELFGYERPAIGGMAAKKAGLFEIADGGTVVLDEIAELPSHLQVKLAGVLESGQVQRLNDPRRRQVDVRLITTTHESLARLVERFDPQLWQHLLTLEIPPLRERPEDIPVLASTLLRRIARNAVVPPVLSPAAQRRLVRHGWPGNVRELGNVLERAVIYGEGKPEILPQDLKFDILGSGAWRH